MKRLTAIFTLLTALLLATSCSKDELPGCESTDETEQMQTYTFSVSADPAIEGEAETRSQGTPEEQPTRCYMQILTKSKVETGIRGDNGSFTFSVNLPSETTQTFLFWAVNATGNAPTDLRAVAFTQGKVAFAASVTGTPENVISNGVKLKHVVTKVSLQHNGDNTFSPKKDDVMKVTLPCATTYDVSNLSVTTSGTYEFTHTFTEGSDITGESELCSLYELAPSDASAVDISFRTHQLTISNMPTQANTHITLRGDFSSSNDKWEPTESQRKEAFQSCFFKEDGKPKGDYFNGDYVFYSNSRP